MAAWWTALQATGGLVGCAPKPTEAPPVTEVPTEAPPEPVMTPTEAARRDDVLVAVSWGGSYQEAQRKAFFDPFEEEYGVTVLDSGDMDFAKLMAMVESGVVEWDVCDDETFGVIRGQDLGILEPIDYSLFEDIDDIIEDAIFEYGVVTIFYSDVIAYNTDVYPTGTHPQSWADFWDVERFPGRRGLYDYVSPALEQALMADGVPIDELYPIDAERGFASLDRIRDYIVWWEAGAQPAQLLSDGELDICSAWNGRIWTVAQEGAPVAIEYNQGILESDSWIIPKGAPHKELAQEFVAFASRADRQAELVQLIPYGPVNKRAFDFISDEMAPFIPTFPANLERQAVKDYMWLGRNENIAPLIEAFEAWKLA